MKFQIDNDQNGNNANGSDASKEYAAIAFVHKFTKKTRVYAGLSSTDHKNSDNSLDQDNITVGMRITF